MHMHLIAILKYYYKCFNIRNIFFKMKTMNFQILLTHCSHIMNKYYEIIINVNKYS